jgi:mono/diheme cytochrome c family protein
MKANQKFHAILLIMLPLLYLSLTSSRPLQSAKFAAPASANDLKNPVKGDVAATAEGKKIYDNNCAICHGAKGKGDGVAAAGLNKQPADHSSATFQSQTDGAIFWKVTQGNSPMPSYKAVYSETQRWQLVNYMRTLSKTKK